MAQVSFPGVYIQEVPSGVRTIAGVATSVTAFVGYTRKGEMNKAVSCLSFADFQRSHQGLDSSSPLSYAVSQFYKNGGSSAYIVRVARDAATATWHLENDAGDAVLDVLASSPGSWGSELRIHVERDTARNPSSEFNLIVLRDDAVLETHRNLTLESGSSLNVASVVNNASAYVRVNVIAASTAFTEPAFALGSVFAASADVTGRVIAGTVFTTLNGVTAFLLDLGTRTWTSMSELVTALNDTISANPGARDALIASESAADGSAGSGTLKISSVDTGEHAKVSISLGASGSLASALKLGIANGGIEVTGAAQQRPAEMLPPEPPDPPIVNFGAPDESGADGLPGSANDLIGTAEPKTGMQALLDVDLFNLLVIPETPNLSEPEANAVIAAGALLCESRRAFYIVDPPFGLSREKILTWWASRPQTSYAAGYFPAVKISDPLDGFRPRTIAASGTMAGVYSRTDATRGVWKAPAGMDATLNGIIDLELPLNDLENGALNPKGINALRSFPASGRVAWGARTMLGDDAQASEYKYIPIRRLALFIEESLYRGTQWVVFEPNDEALYAQIRLNLGVFMNGLFRRGAFQGTTPQEAYFVKCDKETTTQADRDLGIVNIIVGFAPLKPAEFVVISFQQIAGDLG